MIKQEFSLFKNAMNLGALTGLIISVIQLLLFMVGMGDSSGLQWLMYMVLILSISWGARQYRDKASEGYISYGTALGFGTLVALGASLVFAFFIYIWMKYVDTDYIHHILNQLEITMYENNMDEKQIEMFMELYRTFLGPAAFALGQVFNLTLIGFVAALIVSIFTRNPKPIF